MLKKLLLASALAIAATSSFAQVYFEGAVGGGLVNTNMTFGSTTDTSWSTVNKTTSAGYRVAAGYSSSKDWSAEILAIDFGKSKATAKSPQYPNPTMVEIPVTGTGAAVYWKNSSAKWDWRMGLNLLRNKSTETYTNAINPNASTTNVAFGASLGGAYKLTNNLAAIANIDTSTFKVVANSQTTLPSSESASLISVGLRASF